MKWFKKKDDTVMISDFEKEWKKRNRSEKRKKVINDSIRFVNENKEAILLVTSAAVPMVAGVSKITSKALASHRVNKEIRFKDTHIYDRSLGRYTELKRKIRPNEALKIEERRKNGEKLNSILNDMGLLKG